MVTLPFRILKSRVSSASNPVPVLGNRIWSLIEANFKLASSTVPVLGNRIWSLIEANFKLASSTVPVLGNRIWSLIEANFKLKLASNTAPVLGNRIWSLSEADFKLASNTVPVLGNRIWSPLGAVPRNHRKTRLSGPELVDSGHAPHRKTLLSGGLWGTPGTPTPSQNLFIRTETGGFRGAHRIAKPLYPFRFWWVLGRTPPKTIAKPLYQDRIHWDFTMIYFWGWKPVGGLRSRVLQCHTGEARCGAHVFEGVFGLEHEPVTSVKMKAKQGPGCSGGSPIRTKPLNPTHNVKRGDSSCFCHYDRQNSFILKEAMHKARKNPKYDLHLSSSSVTTRSSKYSLNSQRKTTRCSSVVFLVGVRLQSRGQPAETLDLMYLKPH